MSWSQAKAQPIDLIMKLENVWVGDPDRKLVSGRCQYPQGTYLLVNVIDEWDYDMLFAFGVPEADETLTKALINIFKTL